MPLPLCTLGPLLELLLLRDLLRLVACGHPLGDFYSSMSMSQRKKVTGKQVADVVHGSGREIAQGSKKVVRKVFQWMLEQLCGIQFVIGP